MSFRKLAAALLVVAGSAIYTSSAQAAFTLEFVVDGVSQGMVTDGGAGDLLPGTAGQILYSEGASPFSVAGFLVEVTSSITNVNGPAGAVAHLITNIQVTRDHDGTGIDEKTLEVIAIVTDFAFPDVNAYLVESKFSGTATLSTISTAASATFESFFDDDNNPANGFGTPTPLMTADSSSVSATGTWGGPAFANSVSLSGDVPFALINRTTFNLTNDGAKVQSTGVTEASAVPEPGTMALLALGGLGLAGARMRRRKAT